MSELFYPNRSKEGEPFVVEPGHDVVKRDPYLQEAAASFGIGIGKELYLPEARNGILKPTDRAVQDDEFLKEVVTSCRADKIFSQQEDVQGSLYGANGKSVTALPETLEEIHERVENLRKSVGINLE